MSLSYGIHLLSTMCIVYFPTHCLSLKEKSYYISSLFYSITLHYRVRYSPICFTNATFYHKVIHHRTLTTSISAYSFYSILYRIGVTILIGHKTLSLKYLHHSIITVIVYILMTIDHGQH